MKLLEDMEDLGGSVHAAIHKMISDMFREDLDDEVIEEIVNNLGLSDLLALDRAYTEGDKETVRNIIGPLPQLEYSMGRQATSQASNRPKPSRVEKPQAKNKEAPAKDITQTNRNYNQGSANADTTKNVDSEDDPDQMMQDPEVEESMVGAPDYNPAAGGYNSTKFKKGDEDEMYEARGDDLNSSEVVRALELAAEDDPDEDMMFASGLQQLANHINQKYPDSVSISQIMNLLRHPDLQHLSNDDVKYALQGAGLMDMFEAEEVEEAEEETNIVDMVEWLKRRAGIA